MLKRQLGDMAWRMVRGSMVWLRDGDGGCWNAPRMMGWPPNSAG